MGLLRASSDNAVLTARATPPTITKLKQVLRMDGAKLLRVNINRQNIYLQKTRRLPGAKESYKALLEPMAKELDTLGDDFPLTIVYSNLQCISMVPSIFRLIVKDTRLYAMFHTRTEDINKSYVLKQLSKEKSGIRLVFATEALGMGVNTRNVARVIHITPSSSLETYFQEIGRAGRGTSAARAILYYNPMDCADNRHTIAMK